MNPFHQFSRFLAVCAQVILMIMISCQTTEPEPSNNSSNGNIGNNGSNNNNGLFTAVELSSFLIFRDDSDKIQGQPLASPDGQIKIDVEDTIYEDIRTTTTGYLHIAGLNRHDYAYSDRR